MTGIVTTVQSSGIVSLVVALGAKRDGNAYANK
jgi:hypothetical protein